MLKKICKTIIVLLSLLLVSVGFVSISVFFGSYVESEEEFRNAPFGFPVPFLYQDVRASGGLGYEGSFPRWFKLQFDFLDHDPNFDFIPSHFIYSVLIVFSVITILHDRSSK